ncbi:ABC-type transport auxiliary lipoprotein family protein [Acidobacteriota bacterium]
MKKFGMLLLLVIIGHSCMSSPPKRYHQIYLPENLSVSTVKIEKTLYIDRVGSSQIYDNFEIVYRDSPYHLNYYSYDFWAQKPGEMIQDTIYNYFHENRNFLRIYRDLLKGDPDLILKARIRVIEEEDHEDAWFARLSMEIEIRDFNTDEVIVFHEFEKLRKLPEMDIDHLSEAISHILEEELILVLNALSTKISQ